MKELLLDSQCFRFIAELIREVQCVLTDADGNILADLSPLHGIFAQRCLQEDVGLMFRGKPPGHAANRRGELELAYATMLAGELRNGARRPVYPVVPLTDETAIGLQPVAGRDDPSDAKSPVATAVALARTTLQDIFDRIAVLDFLLYIGGRRGWESVDGAACASRARQILFSKATRQELTLLRLVLVTGDAVELDAVRKELARNVFGEGMSLIEYVAPNGRTPHRHPSHAESRFREEIQRLVSMPVGALSTD
ncbi:hypothetical protein [Burkholderia cenocepacia]|uniref:hypothetical protein n=1 Tax=Burkholderia cenocepacia TaxID=95486 RepID=UPI000762078C|nr:hypothetical protein [Burkholderia cenocepacia]KWU17899.1 hypothetical protein AS149_14585 [Burkholderia cenocepacia]